MRVALDGSFWDEPRTGSGQYIRHLWTALSELTSQNYVPEDGDTTVLMLPGALSFVLLLPPGSPSEDPASSARMFRTKQARAIALGPLRMSGRSRNLDKLMWEEWRINREMRHTRASVLHVPYLSAPLHKNRPTVVTAHDMIPWVVPGYRESRLVRLYLRLATAGVRHADIIMADSEASRKDVIKVLNVRPEKVHTVYLGIEQHGQYTEQELAEVRARFGLPPHYAFYMGGFDNRKNVPLLLNAWRDAVNSLGSYRNAPVLAIAGAVPEPGGVFPDTWGEVAALGFSREEAENGHGPLRFLGRISEEDKPKLMSAACLFAYPSAYEGFGLDPLEAMSVGCAVVSSSGGSLSEVVGSGGLLVPPGDRAALTRAIVRVWQNRELRRDLSARGQAHAAQFTWQRTAEQTLQLYRQAAKEL